MLTKKNKTNFSANGSERDGLLCHRTWAVFASHVIEHDNDVGSMDQKISAAIVILPSVIKGVITEGHATKNHGDSMMANVKNDTQRPHVFVHTVGSVQTISQNNVICL